MGGDRAIAMVTRARQGRDALNSPSSVELDAPKGWVTCTQPVAELCQVEKQVDSCSFLANQPCR